MITVNCGRRWLPSRMQRLMLSEWRLPLWQFDADDPSGFLPDLHALQAVFPGGVVSLSQ
jgi:hypothetical protein